MSKETMSEKDINQFIKYINEEIKKVDNFSKSEKIEYLLQQEYIGRARIQRVFSIGYNRACDIIDSLVNCGAVEQKENLQYAIVSQEKFKNYFNKWEV